MNRNDERVWREGGQGEGRKATNIPSKDSKHQHNQYTRLIIHKPPPKQSNDDPSREISRAYTYMP